MNFVETPPTGNAGLASGDLGVVAAERPRAH
jgi:hypothetical protein